MLTFKIEYNGIHSKRYRATLYQKTESSFKRVLKHHARTKEQLFKEVSTKLKRMVKTAVK